ncbi:hypothetical protein [Nioella sediminis]|jgi:hypothetical protein|uniref:hypothetical protein n=1 Tax=Nioella sediminis TaxID=1912092 RepID=UPI0008FD8E27|nr:hypothetical protein [Nioella sediminis]TBX16605.1 hypothetical protein TK43_17065 [Roseovarius sp. JS7-11]
MQAFRNQSRLTYLIWGGLALEIIAALITGRWTAAFVAFGTLGLSMTPLFLASRLHIHLPKSIVAVAVAFVFATLFLGEVFDFYERLWWWDIALHGLSAVGFGIAGFLFVFILFEGDRYAAPPWAMGLLAASIGIMIGVLWEIFEFAMDQAFGLNMQKSGLPDTMGDLIVDVIGASLGGTMGGLYLRGQALGSVSALVDEFVALNSRFFSRFRRKR